MFEPVESNINVFDYSTFYHAFLFIRESAVIYYPLIERSDYVKSYYTFILGGFPVVPNPMVPLAPV